MHTYIHMHIHTHAHTLTNTIANTYTHCMPRLHLHVHVTCIYVCIALSYIKQVTPHALHAWSMLLYIPNRYPAVHAHVYIYMHFWSSWGKVFRVQGAKHIPGLSPFGMLEISVFSRRKPWRKSGVLPWVRNRASLDHFWNANLRQGDDQN